MDAEILAWCERVRGCEGVQLMAELHQLARRDRRCEVRMLVYLGEVDERRLFLGEGFSSMFRYATAVLRMSEPQTFLRIQIARLAKKFPVVLEMLAQGALNLSTLKLLDPHLTNDNHVALLERARNKTKREVELLVAELAPKPDVPSTIRKLPEPAAPRQVRDGQHLLVPEAPASLHAEQAAAVQDTAVRAAPVVAPAQVQRVPVAFASEAPRAASTPLRPGRYKWEMTAGQSLPRSQRILRRPGLRGGVHADEARVVQDVKRSSGTVYWLTCARIGLGPERVPIALRVQARSRGATSARALSELARGASVRR
jgi:hypothetical protein